MSDDSGTTAPEPDEPPAEPVTHQLEGTIEIPVDPPGSGEGE